MSDHFVDANKTASFENAPESKRCSKDTIYRQAAIDAVNNLTYPSSLVDVKRKLVDLPSAEREKGEWVDDVAYYDEAGCPCIVSRCNRCGGVGPISNFCPNCGADMRKEKNDGIR